jgi:hypothetical protein
MSRQNQYLLQVASQSPVLEKLGMTLEQYQSCCQRTPKGLACQAVQLGDDRSAREQFPAIADLDLGLGSPLNPVKVAEPEWDPDFTFKSLQEQCLP